MSSSNRVTTLFGIQKPIIQAGMIWASGWRLASEVTKAGGLGLIGAGSMYPDVLRDNIRKCQNAIGSSAAFGVNVPLVVPGVEEYMKIIVEEKVPIVFTSAGNPNAWTSELKMRGIKVVHVVSSSKFAIKAEEAGCDAVVAEGFEAGGHNGKEETTSMVLIPGVVQSVERIPVIAAGGIYSGRSMLAAMTLGAEAVQIGSRFVTSIEASSHPNFKDAVVNSKEGDTHLSMKVVTPVRLLKNDFYQQVVQAEATGASREQMLQLLGRARAKKGMFEGDLSEGELEIGQVSAHLHSIQPAGAIVEEIWSEFLTYLADPLKRP